MVDKNYLNKKDFNSHILLVQQLRKKCQRPAEELKAAEAIVFTDLELLAKNIYRKYYRSLPDEDVVLADMIFSCWRAIDRFRTSENCFAYATTCMVNTIRMLGRNKIREIERNVRLKAELLAQEPSNHRQRNRH